MKKTLVSIERAFDKEFVKPREFKDIQLWSDESYDNNGSTGQIIKVKKFIRQQILALLKGLEGEIDKKKYVLFPSSGVKDWKDKSKCLDYYNSALDEVKAILQNKMKEVKV